MIKILIMGLPGAGKTTLAHSLKVEFMCSGKQVIWLNADEIRKQNNDWDFSHWGRIRQSTRMAILAEKTNSDYVICDFVAPLEEMRNIFNADWTIWVDTISKSRFTDTDKVFEPPDVYDFRITEQDSGKWAKIIAKNILNNHRPISIDWKGINKNLMGVNDGNNNRFR